MGAKPDESFWKGIFDKAESNGMTGTLCHDEPSQASAQEASSSQATSLKPERAPMLGAATQNTGNNGAPNASAQPVKTGVAKTTLQGPPVGWGMPVLVAPQVPGALLDAVRAYGLDAAESTPPLSTPELSPTVPTLNATVVTIASGEIKVYLRAFGMSTKHALEAISLASLSLPQGQPRTIAEVVLNGQTIYTQGATLASPFILTC